MKQSGTIVLLVLWLLCPAFRCSQGHTETTRYTGEDRPRVYIDLEEIRQRGTLEALLGYNSLSYFIYRGEPMGYDFELLQMFANYLGVQLHVRVVSDPDSIYHYLNTGKGDIAAYRMDIKKTDRKKARFTVPIMEIHQVLVQRKPLGWEKMPDDEIEKKLIRDFTDLAGKQVHVRMSSSQADHLFKLIEENNITLDIIPVGWDITEDDLIRMVAEGEIDYTITDENIALLGSTYYPNIDVATTLSAPQGVVWVVRKNAPLLYESLNEWIVQTRKSMEYNLVYKKYFKNPKQITRWAQSDYFSVTGGMISPYDSLMRKYAVTIGWDWRLLAALIYEESGFDPSSCSWAGAEGLMQIMPLTGLRFGAYDLSDPEQNIRAGVAYLQWLDSHWADIDSSERIYFILASYNAGETHVRDAVRLAEKFHADPCTWKNHVERFMLLKSNPRYYNDPVVSAGFCRGSSVIRYVTDVLNRYRHYVQRIPT
ncbi:MAG: lytic transglycosylase F [Chitinophagales bacterium]|nr:MAG: lytic transglycosylase F [Chitinophagales bacterium]